MEKYYIISTKYSFKERKTKKNGKVYDVIFHVINSDGEYKKKELCGFSSKATAKKAYAEFIQEHCEIATENPAIRQDKRKEPTVKDLIQKYVTTLGNQNKESTIYDKIKIYDLFIIPQLGELKISALTTQRLYEWQDELWNSKNPKTGNYYSYAYLSKIRTHFQAFINYANKRYDYKVSFKNVVKPKRTSIPKEKEVWTREEFDQFINVVDDPMYHCLFTMMYFSGRRKGEIFALTPKDIRKDGILWNKTISRKTLDGSPYKITPTKQYKTQIQPIAKPLKKELEIYKGQEPFFFGGEKPLAENTVTRKLDFYIKKAGVKRLVNHEMRHSYVSMLIHLGASYKLVAELIGDSAEQVIRTYGHLWSEDKIAIVNKIK